MKTVCPKGRVGSNPTLSAQTQLIEYLIMNQANYGEVPKLAEGAPLERE